MKSARGHRLIIQRVTAVGVQRENAVFIVVGRDIVNNNISPECQLADRAVGICRAVTQTRTADHRIVLDNVVLHVRRAAVIGEPDRITVVNPVMMNTAAKAGGTDAEKRTVPKGITVDLKGAALE